MIKDIYRGAPPLCENLNGILDLLKPGSTALVLGVGDGLSITNIAKHENINHCFGVGQWNDKDFTDHQNNLPRNISLANTPLPDIVDKLAGKSFDFVLFDHHDFNLQDYFDYWVKLKDWGIFAIAKLKAKSGIKKFKRIKDVNNSWITLKQNPIVFFVKIPNPGKRIILIGNGLSVKHEEYGERIDSFDEVYRFNCFETSGHEKYVGKKTDVWVLNQSLNDVMPKLKNIRNGTIEQPVFDRYLLAPYYCLTKYGDNEVPIKKMHQYKQVHDQGHIIEKVSQMSYWNASIACEIEKPVRKRKQATTGTIAIQHLIEQGYNNITLCGFDMALSGIKRLPHYFEKNNPNTHHNTPLENKYLNRLMDCGIVKLL